MEGMARRSVRIEKIQLFLSQQEDLQLDTRLHSLSHNFLSPNFSL